MAADDDPTQEVTDLLQHLIRNACVNDGTAASGGEARSVDTLAQYLGTSGLDVAVFEPAPGRASLVTRIEGRDPSAPTLLLMGHTDVVPANAAGWQRDPFGGELVDGEVWGRGAVDMLNLTASMAVAVRRLASRGFTPEGTLVYLAVADEEALGIYGAEHLVANELDAVGADYVITESGGIPIPSGDGVKLPVIVGEKGTWWCTLRIKGTPGHASQPYRTDNALVKAAEVVRRLATYTPPTVLHDTWQRFVRSMDFPAEFAASLLDADELAEQCRSLPVGLARQFHACTHTTIAPTVVHGGVKTNVIPDAIDLELDIRTLPGQSGDDVRRLLADAIGDLWDAVEIVTVSRRSVDGVADRHAAVGFVGPDDEAVLRRRARSCRCSRSGRPTHVSSAGRAARRTASDCSRAARPTSSTARCSTATTSASTSIRCACRPRSGKPSPPTSCRVRRGLVALAAWLVRGRAPRREGRKAHEAAEWCRGASRGGVDSVWEELLANSVTNPSRTPPGRDLHDSGKT